MSYLEHNVGLRKTPAPQNLSQKNVKEGVIWKIIDKRQHMHFFTFKTVLV